MPAAPVRSRLGKLLPLLLIAALALLIFAMGWHRALSLEFLVQRRAELDAVVAEHAVAAWLGFVGLYTLAVAMSVPGAVFLTIAGGILFGWLLGGIAAVLGATLGATLLFLLVRYALADLVRRRLGGRLAALVEGFRADAFNYLLFLRLVPGFPFWLVNLAGAVVGMSLTAFVAATAFGILPGTFAYAVFGSGLDSVLAAQEAAYATCLSAGRADCRLDFDVSAALTPQLFAALTALGVAALVPVLAKRWRARTKRTT